MSLTTKDARGITQTLDTFINVNGEHVSRRYSNQVTISPSITVTASSYTSGFVVGGVLAFTNAVRTGLGGTIDEVIITDKSGNIGAYDLWFFDSNPNNGSTVSANHGALTLAAVDLQRSIGHVNIAATTPWILPGTGGSEASVNIGKKFNLASGTSLYAICIARGTPPTFASTSDFQIRLKISQN